MVSFKDFVFKIIFLHGENLSFHNSSSFLRYFLKAIHSVTHPFCCIMYIVWSLARQFYVEKSFIFVESSQVRLPRLDVVHPHNWMINGFWVDGALVGHIIQLLHLHLPHKSIRQPMLWLVVCVIRIYLKWKTPLLLESHNSHIP